MLSVSCRDVGVDCDFRGTGKTEEELMNNLIDHAIKDHGYTREYVMKPEMQEKIKAKIKESWKYGSAGSQLSVLKHWLFIFVGFFMLFEMF
jgi:predicted small metal-binding protein